MRPLFWLAGRELVGRRASLALGVLSVAAAVALTTTVELLARAREETVARRMDAMGPSLLVVRAGNDRETVSRFEAVGAPLDAAEVDRIRTFLGDRARRVTGRVLGRGSVQGRELPLLGVEAAEVPLASGEAALGAEAARRLGVGEGGEIHVAGAPHRVAVLRPFLGGGEDLAVLLPIDEARRLAGRGPVVDAVAVYGAPHVPVGRLAARLEAVPGWTVVRTERGGEAEEAIGVDLRSLRLGVYLAAAVLALLLVAVAAHRNAEDRRVEVATLAAVGASTGGLASLLLGRAALTGSCGGLVGVLVGATLAITQDGAVLTVLGGAVPFLAFSVAAALGVGLVGALPAALRAAAAEHVTALQT